MAYQVSAEEILALAALPLFGRMAQSGRGGVAANVLSSLASGNGTVLGPQHPDVISSLISGATGEQVTPSPDINKAPVPLTPEQVLTLKGNLKARDYPKKDHVTRTLLANGAHNSGLNESIARDAARMQTLNEHNDALLKYLRPGMSPKEVDVAIRKGVKEEKKLPQYWDDLQNRRNFNVRSDAVHGIRITPDAKIQVKWRGSPTWYTFRQYPDTHKASLEAQKLIMSPSLGRAVWPVLTRKGGDKLAAKGYGKWNIEHYNGAYANG
jgi:hypothetical protein